MNFEYARLLGMKYGFACYCNITKVKQAAAEINEGFRLPCIDEGVFYYYYLCEL